MHICQKLCVLKQTAPDFSLCSYIEGSSYTDVQPFYRLSFHRSQPMQSRPTYSHRERQQEA